MKKSPLPLFLAALLTAHTVHADQIVQTKSFGPDIPQFDTVLTFDSYAGALSDIESIEVTWSMDILDGFLVIDNDAIDAANGSYEFGASMSVDGSNTDVTLLDTSFSNIFSDTEVVNSGTFNLSGNDSDGSNDYSPDGPDGISVDGVPGSGSGGGTVNSFFYSDYVSGDGGSAGSTFDIGITTSQYLTVTSNGGTEYAITPVNASGVVTITYNYVEPVPEPSSVALLAVGGLCLLRRRR